ncbi:MAG: protein kinase [Nannocystaceae bacterium]
MPNDLPFLQRRLLEEAQRWRTVRCTHVPAVSDVGAWGSYVYVVTEVSPGRPLLVWLADQLRTWVDVLDVFDQLSCGLTIIHAEGLVHNDVTPENIRVDEAGRASLVDFGLVFADGAQCHEELCPQARRVAMLLPPPRRRPRGIRLKQRSMQALSAVARSSLAMGPLVGTRGYRAPEVAMGATCAASDQFGLCVTLFEALYARRVFGSTGFGSVCAALQHVDTFHSPRLRSMPRGVISVLRRGLSPDPEARFDSVHELVRELKKQRRTRVVPAFVATLLLVVPMFAGLIALAPAVPWAAVEGCRGAAAAASGPSTRWRAETRVRLRSRVSRIGGSAPTSEVSALLARLDRYVADWRAVRDEGCYRAFGPVRRAIGARAIDCVRRSEREFANAVEGMRARSHLDWPTVRRTMDGLPDLRACVVGLGSGRRIRGANAMPEASSRPIRRGGRAPR